MDKKIKKMLIWGAIVTVVIAIISAIIIIVGIYNNNDDTIVAGAMVFILYIAFIIAIFLVRFVNSKFRNNQPVESASNESEDFSDLSYTDKKLLKKYAAIGKDEYNDIGFVSFVNEKITFSAEAKFGYIKDFNNIPGYHLAFTISGTELVSMPEDYDDSMDYEDNLFTVDLGYFDEVLLSTPENDNGIIVDDIENLEGQKIDIQQFKGYVASIKTVESDDIDIGEIRFVKWTKNRKVIKFKLLVGIGLGDIVVGTVELKEDKEAS